ncbi:MAG: hypothetical protein ACQETI_10530 [Halobacteriota archaeon]
MPVIRISAEQREDIEDLQTALEETVGPYGHVRPRDAVQYLLDRYAADVGDLTGVESNHPPLRDTGEIDAGFDVADTDGDVVDGGSDAAGKSGDDEAEPSETGADSAGDSGTSRLDAMMNLLETHDDKWCDSEKADERYEVDLPDGTTEYARTKDDVRALLFKHYR